MRRDIARSRQFRTTMSRPEVLLWSRLKRLRELGFHIRRQAPFKGYFLDFVCYARRVVIEVDGGQHADDVQADHDLVRDKILRAEGFHVLRFWTRDIRENLDGVMTRIVQTLTAAPHTMDRRRASGKPGSPHPDALRASVPPH
jgi:very-short-patch-repair endonuclease